MLEVHDEKIPITKDEGGVLHVAGTRVTLDCVVRMFDEGASPEEIAEEYDSIKLDDVYAVITYYLRHQEAVKAYLLEQEKESESAQKKFQNAIPRGLRNKLLRAKRDKK